jgi:Zn-dependent metalloprotease
VFIRIQDLNFQFEFHRNCRESVAQGLHQVSVSDDNQLTGEARTNAQKVADFITHYLGDASLSSKTIDIVVNLNTQGSPLAVKPPQGYGVFACFFGEKFMSNGAYSYSSSLTCVAHEILHGVVYYSCQNLYNNRSLELLSIHESFADIFAIMVANGSKPFDKWEWGVYPVECPGCAPSRNLHPEQQQGVPIVATTVNDLSSSTNPYFWIGICNFAAYYIITYRDVEQGCLFTTSDGTNIRDIAKLFFDSLLEFNQTITGSTEGIQYPFFTNIANILRKNARVMFGVRGQIAVDNAFELVGLSNRV